MSKLEMLYSAIKGMTSPQKRIFRLEINKLGKNSYYELIFDYLDSQDSCDKDNFKNFVKRNNILGIHGVVGYLLDKLVIYVYRTKKVSIHEDRVAIELRNLCEKAYAMMDFGFFSQALKIWWKILRIACKNHRFNSCAEAVTALYHFGLTKKIEDFDYGDGLKLNVYERLKQFGDESTKYWQLRALSCHVYTLATRKSTIEEWQEISNLKLLDDPMPGDYESYYSSKGLYLLYTEGLEAAVELYKEYIELLFKLLETSKLNYNYLILFDAKYNYLASLYWCNPELYKVEALEFGNSLKEYSKITSKVSKGDYQNMIMRFNIINSIVQTRRLTLIKHYTLEDVRQLDITNKWHFSINHERLSVLLLMHLAYLCVLIRAYDAFHEYRSRLKHFFSIMPDPTNYIYEMKIISLIELYETRDDSSFEKQLNNFIHKINNTKSNASLSVVRMANFLKELRNSRSPQTLMKNTLPKIITLEKQDYIGGKVLPFFTWIQRRVSERE